MIPEFEEFKEIKKLSKAEMTITQKIHGTNAQVYIYVDDTGVTDLAVGSRTRWIAPGDDNYGFAEFVYANKQEFIDKLGLGRHYGEWAGPGINSGEGLTKKTFVLFNHFRYTPESPLPPQTCLVPVLYSGPLDLTQIHVAMADLKANGSKLAPGFMNPEGVVAQIFGTRYKNVFTAEETQWAGTKSPKAPRENKVEIPVAHLLQPVRLEKLLSRDESYLRDYPKTMGLIAKAYIADLEKEGQFTGSDAEIKGIKKAMGGQLFAFISELTEKAAEDYQASRT